MESFDYTEAFSRNIGLLTPIDQVIIRNKTIAIAGLGGVGGSHLISLVRQGFERFKISDLDLFELKNFNRQYGANIKTVGKSKVKTMVKMALEINPNCEFKIYNEGISKENIDSFLNGVDIAIDGLDFFEIDIRRLYFQKCHRLRIPIITAGPIGFGTAYLIFDRKSLSFDEYFNINNRDSYEKKIAKFIVGLTPHLLQRKYLKGFNLKRRIGPSSITATNLCSSVVINNILKLALKKGKIYRVPYYNYFDPYLNKFKVKRNLNGNKSLYRRLLINYVLKNISSV